MKLDTRSLLWVAQRTRQQWPKGLCRRTRRDLAGELKDYRQRNTHRTVRRAYSAGDALCGNM
jgi:hypothetical protein